MRILNFLYYHLIKIVAVTGLFIGVIGAIISIGDDVAFLRAYRDQAEPWISIRIGLKDLETFDVIRHDKTGSRLDKGEPGYYQLMKIIQRNMDPTIYGTPVALWAQPRGMQDKIAARFVRQPVYFGVVTARGAWKLLEDKVLLESWIREYRQQYYLLKGLRYILVSFVLQLLATLLPVNPYEASLVKRK